METRISDPIWLMPDVGDVLEDESLADHDPRYDLDGEDMLGKFEEEELGITYRRVLHVIEDEEPFMSLSPPPTHLLISEVGVHEESLQHWLSSTTLSSLTVSFSRGIIRVCKLLRNLPPDCHLRSFALWRPVITNEAEMEMIVDAFCESPACKLENLTLVYSPFALLNSEYASKLGRKCRSLDLQFSELPTPDCPNSLADSLVSSFITLTDGRLQELRLGSSYQEYQEYGRLQELRVLKEELESCKLKRLDMSGLRAELGPDGMSLLVAYVASPACSIHDLGICLMSSKSPEAENKERCSILAQAFQSGSSLSKLKVLRFGGVDSDEAAACVVQILGSPESNCKVRYLSIEICEYHAHQPPAFFKKLHLVRTRIECLRVWFHRSASDIQKDSELAYLSDFLGQKHCPLLWMQLSDGTLNKPPESLMWQMKIANALEANYLLTSLSISTLTNPAARSRASAFLARNRLYKSTGFLEEDRTKPDVARLFLCGHAKVGKTTLRKALLHLNNPNHQTPCPSTLPHGCSFNICFRPDVEQRTRGLEIHQLCFERTQKIVMFDLGGQPDYHIFHHYFMTNTSHDLFIIVCKYTPSKEASQLAYELEYWLRFIVSHRNSVHGPKPRIMLVVNFFQTAVISSFAYGLTQNLRDKYADYVDFGGPTTHHVFDIVALIDNQARPILEKLKMLLVDLLNHKPMIPKLCNDLLSHTLPLLGMQKKQYTRGFPWCLDGSREGKKAFNKKIVDYAEVKEWYVQQQDQAHPSMLEKRVQAALVELHNIGEVVFFPPIAVPMQRTVSEMSNAKVSHISNVEANEISNADGTFPIIIDPNWFCNKVVGELLAPEDLSRLLFERKEIDVRKVLIKSGCPTQYMDEVLRYMQSLDLCYSFNNSASKRNAGETTFIFPAVATIKKMHWPPIFKSHNVHFYGRRIKCKNKERHLIPSGVFARLQVKLQNLCGVGNDQGYRLGYHWASFVKNRVGVMVRFGRVSATKSIILDDDQASKIEQAHTPVSIDMEEDDYPEWIDVLLCCPSSQDAQLRASSAEYLIMEDIKKLIFDICQATSRGIPTVVLEEWVVKHEAQEHVMPLMEIEACIHKNGLDSDVTWKDQESTSVVELLLPQELQRHVISHVQAIQQIQGEFASSKVYNEEAEGDQQQISQQLHGELKVLYDLLISKLERLGLKMDNVLAVVKEIKQDVHKVMSGLRQAEVNIVATCSTGLLEQLLVQGVLPAYCYLTNADGKMRRLKKFLHQRKAIVHFLCESRREGPHVVEGQVGREVVVEKGILMKWAPFLIPSLMVLCCAARFAANAYLPGVAPLFFDPLLDCLDSTGIISKKDLKSQIMPKVLDALFEELDVQIQQRGSFISINEGQRKEGVEVIQKTLGSIEDLDVQKDFGLSLVQVGRRAEWLCQEHAAGHQKLPHRPNPFRDVAI